MTNTKRMFRGLATGIRGWVYGSIVDNGKERCFIIEEHLNQRVPVLYDTIGQYVTCLDAYEGDILFGTQRDEEGTLINTYHGIITYSDAHSRIMVIDEVGIPYEVDEFEFDRVMGNIHQDIKFIREQVLSHNLVKSILHGSDAIVSHETAALLVELSTPTLQSTISVYANADLDIPGVTCHIVDDLDSIPHITISGLKITDKHKTLIDLLTSSTQADILLSSLSNYYNSDIPAFNRFIEGLTTVPLDKYKSIENDIADYLYME